MASYLMSRGITVYVKVLQNDSDDSETTHTLQSQLKQMDSTVYFSHGFKGTANGLCKNTRLLLHVPLL